MKKNQRIAILFLLMINVSLFSAGISEDAAALLTAGTPGTQFYPLTGHRALAVQFFDSEREIKLLLADASGVQKSIRFPCERGHFYFVPSTREEPEFLVYQAEDNALIWYAWKEDGLLVLRQWELEGHVLPRIKQEGILLIKDQAAFLSRILEFVDMQQQTLLTLDAPQANAYYDDVVFTGDGWVLLAREAISNRYALQCVGPAGHLLWTLALPDLEEVDGLFPDGTGGLWLAYSSSYTGPMILCHVNADGVMDPELHLSGEPRVKYLHCSQTLEQGNVILYGTSVAHSKSIYHAFALTLNSAGEALSLDVRNYTERKDYGIEIRQSADGTVYVYSGTHENAAPLLVPFYSLEAVENHGLSIVETESNL